MWKYLFDKMSIFLQESGFDVIDIYIGVTPTNDYSQESLFSVVYWVFI